MYISNYTVTTIKLLGIFTTNITGYISRKLFLYLYTFDSGQNFESIIKK